VRRVATSADTMLRLSSEVALTSIARFNGRYHSFRLRTGALCLIQLLRAGRVRRIFSDKGEYFGWRIFRPLNGEAASLLSHNVGRYHGIGRAPVRRYFYRHVDARPDVGIISTADRRAIHTDVHKPFDATLPRRCSMPIASQRSA